MSSGALKSADPRGVQATTIEEASMNDADQDAGHDVDDEDIKDRALLTRLRYAFTGGVELLANAAITAA